MWKVKVIPISSQCCEERESPQRNWWSRISQHASEAAHGAIWKTKGVALRDPPGSRDQNEGWVRMWEGPRRTLPPLFRFARFPVGQGDPYRTTVFKPHLPFTDSNTQINRSLEQSTQASKVLHSPKPSVSRPHLCLSLTDLKACTKRRTFRYELGGH